MKRKQAFLRKRNKYQRNSNKYYSRGTSVTHKWRKVHYTVVGSTNYTMGNLCLRKARKFSKLEPLSGACFEDMARCWYFLHFITTSINSLLEWCLAFLDILKFLLVVKTSGSQITQHLLDFVAEKRISEEYIEMENGLLVCFTREKK